MSSAVRAVCLLSGGQDSSVTLAEARAAGRETFALSFDYGQRHRHELDAAARVARALSAREHRTVRVDLSTLGGSALTDAIAVPKERSHADIGRGVPPTYVPARNTVFLAVALGWAEVLGARELWIGVNAVDYSGYPDCRPEFLRAFEALASVATAAGAERGERFEVRAPLLSLSKAEIVRRGLALGVDFALTHTCYDPIVRDATVLACGRCDACQLRLRGFAEADVPDPVRYVRDRSGASERP
ncbi:MAG: 7-cyano-7-deazaguanine synthase QueC [Planctomycetes bacterium]|nr:7-cyano-7-deazaguanine synthase QueC [Planctomycetota bacterium]